MAYPVEMVGSQANSLAHYTVGRIFAGGCDPYFGYLLVLSAKSNIQYFIGPVDTYIFNLGAKAEALKENSVVPALKFYIILSLNICRGTMLQFIYINCCIPYRLSLAVPYNTFQVLRPCIEQRKNKYICCKQEFLHMSFI